MQITYMLLDALTTHLKQHLMDSVPEDDPIRASVVKMGLLTDNKTQKPIQIGIQGGDHEKPDDEDGIVTLNKLPDIAMDLPPREIGGGQYWMRRGVVRVEAFFVHKSMDEVLAHRYAYDLLGKVMSHVETCSSVLDLEPDDYDERVISIPYCYANTYFESGGPPESFIFRGKVFWAVFTERK